MSIFYSLILKSQDLTLGWAANLGLSRVTSQINYGGDHKVFNPFSFNLSYVVEAKFKQVSSFGFELAFVQVNANESTDGIRISRFQDSVFIDRGVISDKSSLRTAYFGVPFYYRLKFEKIGFRLGVQPMFLLFAQDKYHADGVLDSLPYNEDQTWEKVELKRFNLGMKLGIDYELTEQLRLRADYYHGLTVLTVEEPWDGLIRNLTIGLQYNFRVDD